jgi:trk system potassium uptake protein TrkH
MHPGAITRFIGILVLFLGLSMVGPLLVSLIYRDGSTGAILQSAMATSAMGGILFLATRKSGSTFLSHRDGVAVVSIGWAVAGLVGTLPFILSGAIPSFTNAYFESISGFTTTGASVLSDIEAVPKGILFWRSQTQWLGGMGIIVLSIAILPFLGIGGMQLYKAEIPSPVVDKLKPRISETAKTLWKVYGFLTFLQILFLALGGMSLYDAISHAFCTLPTGGFSTRNASIAHYGSLYLDLVVIFFMLVAGINFSLHYRLIKGERKAFWKDAECRVFLSLVIVFILATAFNLHGAVYGNLSDAFHHAAFQVSSIITTTGFVTADFDKWPAFSKYVLVLCMFLGAMAGSTGGGMKIMRVMLLIRHGYRELFRLIHPHAVITVKLGGRPVPHEVMSSIWGFFILYIAFFVLASVVMSSLGLDVISAFSSVAACIGNVGPGLGLVGPATNFLVVPALGKWILVFCMLLGRLEIYTVLVMLVPEYWRK